MSSIENIVQQALQDGFLLPSMEVEVCRLCDSEETLSLKERLAFDRLMVALLEGQVVAIQRKKFVNVMAELVMNEAICRTGTIESETGQSIDLGEVVAYCLNRLPPLYATTEEGADFQRQRAQENGLHDLITTQVNEAIAKSLNRPHFFPERQAISASQSFPHIPLCRQLSSLLKQTTLVAH